MALQSIAIKYPVGTPGIVLQANNEYVQQEIFFPTANLLIAVNNAGDPAMGSYVFDLNSKDEIDPSRAARLQSAFRVIKQPMGGANALAFQLGTTGRGDTRGGYFAEPKSGGVTLGLASFLDGGPFDTGTGNCQHFIGNDADGNPISSMHVSTSAPFRWTDDLDGPLRFEAHYEDPAEIGTKPYRTFIGWTGTDWAWYNMSPVFPVRSGETVTPKPASRPPSQDDQTPWPPSPNTPTHTGPQSLGANARNSHLAVVSAFSTPALLGRPQMSNQYTPSFDLLNHIGPISKAEEKQFDLIPVTVQMFAWGAQGGTVVSDIIDTSNGANGQWQYTQRPGNSVYRGGTCPGGFLFLPPEVSIYDYKNEISTGSDFQEINHGLTPNRSISETLVMVGPYTKFAAGVPEFSTGKLFQGWTWGCDPLVDTPDTDTAFPSGSLIFRYWMDGTGLETGGAGYITFSPTGSYGEFIFGGPGYDNAATLSGGRGGGNEGTLHVLGDVPGSKGGQIITANLATVFGGPASAAGGTLAAGMSATPLFLAFCIPGTSTLGYIPYYA